MNKRVVKRSFALLLALLMGVTLVACSTTLKGTYTSTDGLIEQSFTFDKDHNVQMSAFGIEVDGTYEIKDGKITITYNLFGLNYDWVKSFKKDGSSIFIDGNEFKKAK